MNDDVKLVSREAVLGGQNMVSSSESAGTTEAHVDDMMMVLEVADEATPAPIRPRPEWVKISIPLI